MQSSRAGTAVAAPLCTLTYFVVCVSWHSLQHRPRQPRVYWSRTLRCATSIARAFVRRASERATATACADREDPVRGFEAQVDSLPASATDAGVDCELLSTQVWLSKGDPGWKWWTVSLDRVTIDL